MKSAKLWPANAFMNCRDRHAVTDPYNQLVGNCECCFLAFKWLRLTLKLSSKSIRQSACDIAFGLSNDINEIYAFPVAICFKAVANY
jgi:hypothetical protein